MKIGIALVAASLWLMPMAMAQDTKSPDLQQQHHPETTPPPQANAPGTHPAGSDSTQTGTTTKRRKNKVRQAHGTQSTSTKPQA